MKMVINTCFGEFSINQKIADIFGFDRYNEKRTNRQLIELIESGIDCNDEDSKLVVVDIPDNATDCYINSYDGREIAIYVVDGKIHILDK